MEHFRNENIAELLKAYVSHLIYLVLRPVEGLSDPSPNNRKIVVCLSNVISRIAILGVHAFGDVVAAVSIEFIAIDWR